MALESGNIISAPIKILKLGDWGARAVDTVYQAEADGFVTVCLDENLGIGDFVKITTDDATPPTVIRQQIGGNSAADQLSMMSPVKKDDYYEVPINGVAAGNVYPFWIPLQ